MIFVTGDCHSEFQKLSTAAFPEQREMTKDDIVIISPVRLPSLSYKSHNSITIAPHLFITICTA